MKTSIKLIAGVLPALILACGGGVSDVDSDTSTAACNGGKCDSSGFQVISDSVWAACEVTTGEVEDDLGCLLFGADEVLGPVSLTVVGTTAQGDSIAGGVFNASGANFPARLPHDAYPIELDFLLMFDSNHSVSGFTALQLHMPVRLEAVPTEPVVLEQPFDLWRIQLATRERIALFDGEWSVGEGGMFTDASGAPSDVTLRPNVLGRQNSVEEVFLPVPRNAQQVEGRMRVGADLHTMSVSFDGPGRWVGTLDGLRRAHDGDVDLFGSSTDPTDPVVDPVEPVETCTFDYLGWLTQFTPLVGSPDGQLLVEQIECKPVAADAFAAWHELLVNTVDAGAPSAGSILDSDELVDVNQVLSARPDSAEEASYALALTAYEARLTMYAPSAGSVIDDNEAVVINAVIDARPRAVVSDASWTSWFTLYMARFSMYAPSQGSILDNNERGVLANIEAMVPAAAGESVYSTWFDEYMRYLLMYAPSSSSIIDPAEKAVLAVLHQVTPPSSSVESYELWLRAFHDRLREAGSTVDASERGVLIEITAAKPCVADVAAAQATIDTVLQTVTANADLFTEMTAVSECGQ